MKKILSIFLLIALALGGTVKADELTVCKMGTTQNQGVPIYSYDCHTMIRSQVIYPAHSSSHPSEVVDLSEMDGANITSMTFYSNSTSQAWGVAEFKVSLALVDDAELASGWNTASLTTVYEGSLSVVSSQLVITFTTPFKYDASKNLLFDLQTIKKNTAYTNRHYFLGKGGNDGVYSRYGSGNTIDAISGTAQYYIPKTTFVYEAASPSSCAAPGVPAASEITAHSAKLAWDAAAEGADYQAVCVAKDGTPDWTGARTFKDLDTVLTGLAKETEYDFYVRTYCGSEEGEQSAEKKASFTTEKACFAPASATVTDVTSTGATLSWTASGKGETQWQYAVTEGSAAPNDWSEATTELSVELTSLKPATTYKAYVRSFCGEEGESDYIASDAFTTECAAVAAINEAFSGTLLCWTMVDCNSSTKVSDGKFQFYYTKNPPMYLITPELIASEKQVKVEFDYWCYLSSNEESFQVGYSTTTNETAAFTWGDEYKTTNTNSASPDKFSEIFPAGAKYICIKYTANDKYYLFIDNFSATEYEAPACPAISALETIEVGINSAKLGWTKGGEETAWKLQTSADGENWNEAIDVAENPYTFSGLTAKTTYYVRVAANCSELSEWSKAINFTTDCDAQDLLSESFSSALTECWKTSKTGGDYGWTPSSSYRVSATYSMYYYATASTEDHADLVTPLVNLGSKETQLTFQLKNDSYYGQVVGEVYIVVEGAETKIFDFPATSGFALQTVDLSDYVGKTAKFIFRAHGAGTYKSVYIDDVVVDVIPCAKPTGLAAIQGNASAEITWTDENASKWNLRYRIVAEPENEWTIVEGLTAKPHTLEGLTNGSEYEAQVQAACSETRTSDWSDTVKFTPVACQSVTSVSLGIKTYQSVVVEWTTSGTTNCDVRYSTDNGENWTIAQENIEESSTTLGGLTVGTVYTIQVKPSCGDDETWVAAAETFSPVYTAPEADAASAISDKGATFSWSAVADAYSYEYAVTAREVVPAAWTEVAENTVSVNTLDAATEYDFFVRTKFADDGVSAYDSIGFATITLAPQNLQQDGESTTDGATFTWEANGAAKQYQWSIDNTNWSAAQTAIKATVEGLNPGSTYTFYVRSYYSESVQSAATSLSFDTQCATETLPFEQHFNSTSKPNCWTSDNWGASANNWSIDQYTDHTGESSYAASYSAKTNTANSAALVTPKVELSDAAILEFYYQNRYTYYYYSYAVNFDVVILDASDDSELRTKSYTEPSANNAWASDTLDLSAFVGKTIKVKFVGKGVGTSYTAYLKLDDVTITVKPCATPTELAAAASKGSAVVTWTDDEADTWNLRYRVVKAEEPFNDWVYVNNLDVKSHTLNSLDEEAEYEVQVQAVCSTTRSSEWTESVNFTPACPTPGEIQFSNKTYNGVIVSWTAGGAETAWNLEYQKGETGWVPVPTNPLTTPSYTFDDLETGMTYSFTVQAACEGNWTDTVYYTPQYSAPASANVTEPTDTTATASWATVADAPNGYQYIVVERDVTPDWTSSTAINETSVELTKLAGLTEYDFYVRAVYGSNYGAATKAQFSTIAIEPKNVNNTNVTTNTATFIWDNAGAATKYQWSLDNSTWSEPFTGKTVTVDGLTAGTSYTFYVRSYYAEEKVSSPISTPFSTECDVKALGWSEDFNGSTSMPTCWDAEEQWSIATYSGVSSTNALRFKSGASANISLPATELTEEAVLRFSHSNGYVSGEIYVNAVDEEHKLADIAKSSSWKSEEISLAAYTSQTITLIFRGLQNSNSYSMYIDNVSVIAKPCAAITSIDATAALDSVVLAWESDAEAFEYCVVESTAEAADWKATEEKSITVKGLTPEKAYTAYVRSSCSETKKGEAKSATFTPECPAPTALTVGEVTTTTATLSWTAAAGISKYQYKLGSEAWDDENVVEGTNLELTNLDPATEYTLYVRSYYNADAQSDAIDKSFATACGAQPLTFEEDFSGAITCWTLENCHKSTGVTGGEFMFNYNSNPPQYLISPELVPSEKKATVEFEYRARGTYEESFQVGYSLTTNDTTAFVWSDTTFCSVTDKQKYSEKLPASVKYVAIRYTANDKWALYIDNFSVAEYVPTAIDLVGTGADGEKVIKLIENDQLVIIRDGIKYNAQGKRLGE